MCQPQIPRAIGLGTRLFALLAGLLACTLPSPAHAASKQAQERSARKACLAGDYAKGVELLADLFVDTKDPTYIFNQGRCFEQNRRYEDAIGRFQEYLRAAPGMSAEDKALTDKHISDCQNLLAQQTGRTVPPVAATAATASPPPQPAPAEPIPPPAPQVVVTQPPSPALASPGSGLRTAGVVTASVGAAAAVAGGLLNLKANSIADSMGTTIGNYEARNSDRKTYETAAWIGYGVGAACLVTGAILYGIGRQTGADSTTSVALLPAIGPGQAGALLTGGF